MIHAETRPVTAPTVPPSSLDARPSHVIAALGFSFALGVLRFCVFPAHPEPPTATMLLDLAWHAALLLSELAFVVPAYWLVRRQGREGFALAWGRLQKPPSRVVVVLVLLFPTLLLLDGIGLLALVPISDAFGPHSPRWREFLRADLDDTYTMCATSPVGLPFEFVSMVIVAPVAEEFMFRGFLYRWLASRARWGLAALVSSGVFAVLHFDPPTFLPTLFTGLVLAALVRWSGALWPAIALHGARNLLALLLW